MEDRNFYDGQGGIRTGYNTYTPAAGSRKGAWPDPSSPLLRAAELILAAGFAPELTPIGFGARAAGVAHRFRYHVPREVIPEHNRVRGECLPKTSSSV